MLLSNLNEIDGLHLLRPNIIPYFPLDFSCQLSFSRHLSTSFCKHLHIHQISIKWKKKRKTLACKIRQNHSIHHYSPSSSSSEPFSLSPSIAAGYLKQTSSTSSKNQSLVAWSFPTSWSQPASSSDATTPASPNNTSSATANNT